MCLTSEEKDGEWVIRVAGQLNAGIVQLNSLIAYHIPLRKHSDTCTISLASEIWIYVLESEVFKLHSLRSSNPLNQKV